MALYQNSLVCLPIIVSLDELNEDALIEILTKPKIVIVNQYKELFKYDGVI